MSAFFTVSSKADFERVSASLQRGSLHQYKLYVEHERLQVPGPNHPRVVLQGLPPMNPGGALQRIARDTRCGSVVEDELKYSRTNDEFEGSFRVPSPDSAQKAVQELDGRWVEGKRLIAWWEMVREPGAPIPGFRPPPTAPPGNTTLPQGFIPPPTASTSSTSGFIPPPTAPAPSAAQANTSLASNAHFRRPSPDAVPLGHPPAQSPSPTQSAQPLMVQHATGSIGFTTASEMGDADASAEEAWLSEYLAEDASVDGEGEERKAKQAKRS
ncbi:hypothetical protein JCM10296v2_004861 [Rhodotorula toruloides]